MSESGRAAMLHSPVAVGRDAPLPVLENVQADIASLLKLGRNRFIYFRLRPRQLKRNIFAPLVPQRPERAGELGEVAYRLDLLFTLRFGGGVWNGSEVLVVRYEIT